MAQYNELIVHGNDRDLIPYLAGYFAASGPVRMVFAGEAGFHVRQLRERIRNRGEVNHVIVEASQAARIRTALAAGAPRYQFVIKEEHTFEKAHFTFEFDTPSRKVAEELKELLGNLPAGVSMSDYAPRETMRPGSASTEMYAREHDFRFEGHGLIRGDVFAVVDTRAAMCAHDFVRCDEIIDGDA